MKICITAWIVLLLGDAEASSRLHRFNMLYAFRKAKSINTPEPIGKIASPEIIPEHTASTNQVKPSMPSVAAEYFQVLGSGTIY